MMNLLFKANSRQFGRQLCFQRLSKNISTPRWFNYRQLHAESLKQRTLIRVAGEEANRFLQGLITNDMDHLERGSTAIYAMFLNKAGRILYDSIIYRSLVENIYFIECDSSIVLDLVKHLKLFRVRRKISVDHIDSEYSLWVVHGGSEHTRSDIKFSSETIVKPTIEQNVILSQDPRLRNLGIRMIAPIEYTVEGVSKFFPEDEINAAVDNNNDYTTLRYKLGIGEGICDHIPSKSFPIESNGDYLHGISFQKGCYLGQELTARSYHTGVIRKRLMPVTIGQDCGKKSPEEDVRLANGTSVGKMRGIFKGNGLALLRIEKVADSPQLMWNGIECSVSKPFWWPKAAPKRDSLAA